MRAVDAVLSSRGTVSPVSRRAGDCGDLVGWYESDQFLCGARREVLATRIPPATATPVIGVEVPWKL